MIVYRPVSRIISVITIAAMMITAFTGIIPQSAYASTEVAYAVTGGNIYFDKDTGKVTSCDDTVTEAVIPEEIEGVAVSQIGQRAFYEKNIVKKICIPDSVTSIGELAFYKCTALDNVKLPVNLQSLQPDVFRECSSLRSIDLPENLREIKIRAFYKCTSLTEINIPCNVTNIVLSAFAGCTSLEKISVDYDNSSYVSSDGVLYTKDMSCLHTYPAGKAGDSYNVDKNTVKLSGYAFESANVTYVKLPELLAEIGRDCFENSRLVSIEIPDNVSEIQSMAFWNCRDLKYVKLPYNLKTLKQTMFQYCESLSSLIIPDSVTSIEHSVFSYSGINNVVIPPNVTSIGYDAFRNCKNLESVTVPANVKSIGNSAFENCPGLTITAPEGSVAYKYALEKNITVKASESEQQRQAIICDSKFSKKLGCEPFSLGASAKTALTYSSSNSAVATVSADGTVTVKGEGTAVITITAEETKEYTGDSIQVTVSVIRPEEQKIGGTDSFTKLTTDSSFNLNATAEGRLGYVSENPGIVSVSDDGTVTIVSAGKTAIDIYAAETDKYNAASKKVTVTINKAEQTIKAAADSFVKDLKDGSFNLNASAEGALSYSSNNTSVADVSSAGVVSLKGFGSTVITITAAETDKYKTAVKKVNVTVNKPPQTILGADSFTKEYGCGPFGLGASAEGALSYESSNTNIVTVSSSGVVTVKNAGTAVITIIAAETDKYARTTKSVLINIKKDDQDISGDIAFYKTYGCEPFDLGIIAQGKCTFTSSNVKVASVSDKGIVTVNGAGVAVITITSAATGNYNEAVKTVTITVEKASQTIKCKKSISRTFSFETFNIGAVSATDCIYQSSNEKIVTVNEFGDVTLKNPGKVTVTITAVESDNYKSAVKKITISSKLKKPVIKVKALKGGKVRLSWESVPGAKGYKVYIYDKAKKKYVHRLTKKASVKSVTHRGLKKGEVYKYKVKAYRTVNGKRVYSPYSAVRSVKVK